MNKYFESVKPTYIENWPKSLMKLSMSSIPVPLTLNEAASLGRHIVEWGDSFGKITVVDKSNMERIASKLAKAVAMYEPDGSFVRLGSRSPKDVWSAPACVHNATQAIQRLTDCSERMYEDLTLCLQEKYAPTIWVRAFIKDLGYEIRCFVKGGELIAATQYDPKQVPGMYENRHAIIRSVNRYIKDDFVVNSHMDEVVVDLAVRREVDDSGILPATMIEINPFFDLTYPGLFDWKDPEMLGRRLFRCLDADGHLATESLDGPMKFETTVNTQ